ncbi:aspartyl protease family protein [Alteromonas facilis]|uniref:aspartyl protease family protein n=1 Tax=Alteromonas facilis TaxID=2048004 RepID=UPI000C287C67|nr:retroviral-like aspartic protease family protein [Alteromonas facilis]
MKYITFCVILLLSFTSIAEDIPLTRTSDGHLVIPASINGVSANFILDTGATGTVVHHNMLDIFNAEISGEAFNGLGLGDEATAKIETIPIRVNSIAIGEFTSTVNTIYSQNQTVPFPDGISGIIGKDVLQDLSTILDVSTPRLILKSNTASEYDSLDYLTIVQSDMGFGYVEVTLGSHDVRLIVDSGASQTILDTQSVADLNLTLTDHPTAKTLVSENVELPMKQIEGVQLIVGSQHITDDFLTTDLSGLIHSINREGHSPFIGVLGIKELISMGALIDLKHGRLLFR